MREEEESTLFRQRAGRLAKWMEMVQHASQENSMQMKLPDGLQNLAPLFQCFFAFHFSGVKDGWGLIIIIRIN